ncbi:MAG: D-aminoacyl-tRNA deacylase [Porticoccaceae bacterium]|nr:D-aminoacyl-tRNA deacylase [Porticoccaceae bacterium]
MKALIQRVSSASVSVAGAEVGAIERGVLVLLAVERNDTAAHGRKLADKVMNYRIFPDEQGRMNLSVRDINGGLLVVSQFTLAADTRKGLRPSFTPAADPGDAERLYEDFAAHCREQMASVATGIFAADMQVSLCNEGPVTFMLGVDCP